MTLDDIKETILELEDDRLIYKKNVEISEAAWRLAHWSDAEQAEAELNGKHLVTTNTPKNVAKLAFSLIGNNYSITTPTYRSTQTGQEEEANSKARANYLLALWKSWRNVGQHDAFADLCFNQVVRGSSALRVAWIAKPGEVDPWRPSILLRSLNPKNVGYLHDDVSLVVAYETYEESIRKLKLRYPEIVNLKEVKDKSPKDTVTFTDYWWRDTKTNAIYNCFLINNSEFLREPKKSDVPLIPIVIRAAQEYPLERTEDRIDSFLRDLLPEWALECELSSMMMTGLKLSFWPEKYYRNKNGEPVQTLQYGPGAENEVDPTFEFVPEAPGSRPDFNTASLILRSVQERIQKSSFADSLYGMGEPGVRSSFMLNNLTQAGMSALGSIVQAVARSMMEANSIALCMVKKFGVGESTLYAFDDDNNAMRGYGLSPEQIHDSYENHVLIKPAPNLSDDLQRLAVGQQMVGSQILSAQTVRETLVPFRVPDDEKARILREQMEKDPDLLKDMIRQEYLRYTGRELPPAEPDFTRTPAQQPQSIQPPQAFPGAALPPEAQGQLSPEALTGDASVPPELLDMMQGQQLDPRRMLARSTGSGQV